MKAFCVTAAFLVIVCAACGASRNSIRSVKATESVITTPSMKVSIPSMLKVFPLEIGRTWVYSTAEYDAPIQPPGSKIELVGYTGFFTETVIDIQQTNNSIVFTTTIQRAPPLRPDPNDRVRTYEVIENAIFMDRRITIFRWPIMAGQEWDAFGDKDKGFKNIYFWQVLKQGDIAVPACHFENCFQLVLMTGPDHTINWFCPGVGLVNEEYHHHGTVHDRYLELQSTQVK